MGGEIGRKHKRRDQREKRLRCPGEENPADNGGSWRINLLHTSNARVQNLRHSRRISLSITRRRFAQRIETHIALVVATRLPVFSKTPRRNFDELPYSRMAQDICKSAAGCSSSGCSTWRTGSRAGTAPRLLHASRRGRHSRHCRRTWHGGRAGEDRRACWRRRAQAWRQRGRCGGGHPPSLGGELSAGRPHQPPPVYDVSFSL